MNAERIVPDGAANAALADVRRRLVAEAMRWVRTRHSASIVLEHQVSGNSVFVLIHNSETKKSRVVAYPDDV